MPPQTGASGAKKPWGLRILSVIYGLLIFPGALFAMSSVFLFDAPGSENSPLTKLLAFSLDILPLVLVIACIGGLVYSFGSRTPQRIRAGKIFGWLPIVNVLLILVAIGLIQTLCGGQFACHS